MKTSEKPVAGVETPATDDIIVPCEGSHCHCNGWVVTQHPRHTLGGGTLVNGEMREWKPTPEWVAAEAKRIERSYHANSGCGRPVASEERRQQAQKELAEVDALREVS